MSIIDKAVNFAGVVALLGGMLKGMTVMFNRKR